MSNAEAYLRIMIQNTSKSNSDWLKESSLNLFPIKMLLKDFKLAMHCLKTLYCGQVKTILQRRVV